MFFYPQFSPSSLLTHFCIRPVLETDGQSEWCVVQILTAKFLPIREPPQLLTQFHGFLKLNLVVFWALPKYHGLRGPLALPKNHDQHVVLWHCNYLIKLRNFNGFLTKRLAGLQKMSYCNRSNTLNLQSLKSRRLVIDLVLCNKLLHEISDLSITTALNLCTNITRGHCYKLSKLLCTNDATKL